MQSLICNDGRVSSFEFPRNLVEAAEDGHDAALVDRGVAVVTRRAWMAELRQVVSDLSHRWSLELGAPFQPGGVASWVAPARRRSGEQVVLKVGWRHDEGLHEPDGLRAWDGNGVVRLLDTVADDKTTALLLEACQPGNSLSDTLSALEQDVIVTGLLRQVWIEPSPDHPFRPLQAMCDWWADEYEEKCRATGSALQLDEGLSRAGVGLFRSLPGTAQRCVLLFTDLHPGNVLAASREPWLAIDPKPYVGDPTYDALQHMLNFPERLCTDPRSFVLRMAHLLDLDVDRLRQWLFARCVIESVDQPRLLNVITEIAP